MVTKYRNKKCVHMGQTFDSQAELRRYLELSLAEKAGRISGLTRQISFVLAPKTVINGKPKRSLIYRADFQYMEKGNDVVTVEDVKGMLTAVYKIKRHLMQTVHGISIKETK